MGRIANPYARQYYGPWLLLKKNGSLRLKVHPALVARVKKAIIKEKDIDLAFKLINDYDPCRLITRYNKEKQELFMELRQQVGIEDRKFA